MERILSELDSIAEKIDSLEGQRERLGSFLREIKDVEIKDDEIMESRLSLPVERSDLKDRKVAGVDGGLVKQPYHAVDLVLTKAVAAVFEYDGDLKNVSYIPDALPVPKLSVFTEPFSSRDFSLTANLERMDTEIEIMLETLKADPDLLILDGSIVPHPSTKPEKDSPVYERFEELMENYEMLFRRADCLLAGVSEDSRAKKFAGIVSNKILDKVNNRKVDSLSEILNTTRDTNLLFHILNKGERSFCFTYFDGEVENSMPIDSEKIYSFYLKTTEYDRPVRVDFYTESDPVDTADGIASLLLPLSSHNEEYGIPAPLLEADSRASLKEEELDFIHSTLQDKVGNIPSLYKLRRNKRPF